MLSAHAPASRLVLQHRRYCVSVGARVRWYPSCVSLFPRQSWHPGLSRTVSSIPPCTGGCQGACKRPRRRRPLFFLIFVVVCHGPAILSVGFDPRDRCLVSPLVQVGRNRPPKTSAGGRRGSEALTYVPAFFDHSILSSLRWTPPLYPLPSGQPDGIQALQCVKELHSAAK